MTIGFSSGTLHFYKRYVRQLVYQPTAAQLLYLKAQLDFSILRNIHHNQRYPNCKLPFLTVLSTLPVSMWSNNNRKQGYLLWLRYGLILAYLILPGHEQQMIKTNKRVTSKTEPSKHEMYGIKTNGAKNKKCIIKTKTNGHPAFFFSFLFFFLE